METIKLPVTGKSYSLSYGRFEFSTPKSYNKRPIWPQIAHLVSAASSLRVGPFLTRGKMLKALIRTILVEDHKAKLHAKYEQSRTYGFRKQDV